MVQDQGGTGFQTAGILAYVEDLKSGSNKDIGPKDFFEMASSIFINQLHSKKRNMISIRAVLITFLVGLFLFYPIIPIFAKDQKPMNQINIINTNKAPAAIGAYSQGMEVNGTYYFSGQIGIDPATKELKSSFESQLVQILKNIDALLTASGLERSNIVKTTIFLTDLNNFGAVNSSYKTFFNEPFPARSCVETSKLPKNALVEIEVIAHK